LKSRKEVFRALAENELVGLHCEVVKSSQKHQEGLQGKIVDESLNTLTLETKQGQKKIQKKAVTLKISFPNKELTIQGEDLLQRPHERLKKLWRKIR
jgi:ribonuclease P protein subunit POP4